MIDFERFDLYQIDAMLTADERMVRDSVRRWVRDRVLPNIEDWDWNC